MTITTHSVVTVGLDALDILVNDHVVIKGLVTDLAATSQSDQRKDILARLKALLTIHNATEENLVYPALQMVAGDARESESLYRETGVADVVVFELDAMLQKGEESAFGAKATKLRDAVFAHIESEETTAFRHLREKATPEQAEMLTQAVRDFRDALRYEPKVT
jgi:hemerythrin superfamily protein